MSSGSGSPKTIGPAAIVTELAATLVTAITGTASPSCRLLAETSSPISEAIRITRASGWTSTARPVSRLPLDPLIETSEAPQSSPAEAP